MPVMQERTRMAAMCKLTGRRGGRGVERISQLTQLFTVSASLPLKRHWKLLMSRSAIRSMSLCKFSECRSRTSREC